jgi:hypothetical protein
MGLVAEMRSGLEQLLHGDDSGRHFVSPSGYTLSGGEKSRTRRDTGMNASACGMPRALAEQASGFNLLAKSESGLLTRANKKGTDTRPTPRLVRFGTKGVRAGSAPNQGTKTMLAPLATLVFLATLWLIVRLVAETLEASGGRIIAALLGRNDRSQPALPPIRVRLSAPRPVQPLRSVQQWRAAA